MSEIHESEAAMGTGRLLGLFFGLVVLCAIFFAFGFTLGRSSVKPEPAPASTGLPPSGDPKPSPVTAEAGDCPAGQECPSAAPEELTFYKAVDRKEPEARLEPAPPPAQPAVARETRPAAESLRQASLGGFTVQVAAISKQEDADALAAALRGKQYPVFTSSAAADRLIRVQVGPFPTLKEAEAIRARLKKDGYNSIVKK
jgi:cell division septation protein DedD